MINGLPRTRAELRDWVLRKLGAPVLEINIDEEQLEDRISEAISYFQDYHFDGIEKVYIKRKVTATVITFSVPFTGDFAYQEVIKGNTSETEATIIDVADDKLSMRIIGMRESDFIAGETITGMVSGTTATLAATNFIVKGDIDNGYIPVSDDIIAVVDVFPFRSGVPLSGGMFDINYQFALNNMQSLISTDVITYTMFRQNMALLEQTFAGLKGIRFNRKMDRVYLDIRWLSNAVPADEYIVLSCHKALSPDAYTEVYSDFFLREYCYALVKQQWGENLKKFSGIALPGGVTLNGDQIYQEAVEYKKELQERVRKEFENPVDFLLG